MGGLNICTPFSSAFVIKLTRDIILSGVGLKVEAGFAFEDVFLESHAATFFEAGIELEVGKNEDTWLRFGFKFVLMDWAHWGASSSAVV